MGLGLGFNDPLDGFGVGGFLGHGASWKGQVKHFVGGGAAGKQARHAINVRPFHVVRRLEIFSRGRGQRGLHEFHPDGHGHLATIGAFEDGLLGVKADPYAASDASGESQEPGVGVIVGGAGLPCHGPIQFIGAGAGARGGHALQALDQLEGHGGINQRLAG